MKLQHDRRPPLDVADFRNAAESLVDVFRHRAQLDGDRVAFTFLPTEDESPEDRSYALLDRLARAIAARLNEVACPGERALLMFNAGLDYIAALAGCLYAGVIAIPVFPPDPLRTARTLPRLSAIVEDAQATLLLGTTSDLAWAGAMLGQLPGLRHAIASDDVPPELAGDWRRPPIDRDTIALLQYTSGSTGAPRGVVVRHGNLLANLAQMEQAIDLPDAVVCTWLPAYHDMGLIGGILQCWYSGRRNVMLSPLGFFQHPLAWLQAIDRNRATSTAAPDFAYDLCVRKTHTDERAALDLSCLRLALSGAEPVRAATIERFLEAFAPSGLRPDVFAPSYGLAEATLMVSATRPGRGARIRAFDAARFTRHEADVVEGQTAQVSNWPERTDSPDHSANRTHPILKHAGNLPPVRLVACGRPAAEVRVAIVDPNTCRVLSEGQVGEIWVAGANVAAGYWNRDEESRHTFQAHTADGQGPFLRTGDLGFLHEGELYISGRLKDLIVVLGRNFHPQDIEQAVEAAHPALKPHGGAAFSIERDGREQVVVVHEVSRPKAYDLDEVSRHARGAVLAAHDLAVDAIVLIRAGSIAKTTSGKIQRHTCRAQFLAGELDVLHAWQAATRCRAGRRTEAADYVAPRTPLETLLAETWAEILGVERVGVFDDFFDLGGQSLLATQVVNRLAPQLDLDIPLAEVFARPTIAELAELIVARQQRRDAQFLHADEELLGEIEALSDDAARVLMSQEATDVPANGGRAPVLRAPLPRIGPGPSPGAADGPHSLA